MFIQQLVNGLTLGGVYALIAVGYTMVYGIIELINFAHGEIYMLGAFLAFTFVTMLNLPFPLAVLLSISCCALFGVILEFIAYRPLRKAPRLAALITAIGASLFLQNVALMIWGGRMKTYPKGTIPEIFKSALFYMGDVKVSLLQYDIISITIFLMFCLHILITQTKIGTAMRACAQDKTTASLMGINVNRVISFTFAVGSGLGAVAGIIVGVYYNAIFPMMGYTAGVKAFAAAVLGGIGNIPGAMFGGFVLGIAESYGAGYLSSGYRDGIAYAIMILVIIFRPSGILGRKTVVKV
ncbi:MAG: branched-chain amino acid ABC transporter permease [Deltaproteobacteria bacterium]|nr:branched-chain amino acid ABC transporter permease [Candidatus Zymogenaceae bacterium]